MFTYHNDYDNYDNNEVILINVQGISQMVAVHTVCDFKYRTRLRLVVKESVHCHSNLPGSLANMYTKLAPMADAHLMRRLGWVAFLVLGKQKAK